jgi:DNA-binding transcriptional MerR regulator
MVQHQPIRSNTAEREIPDKLYFRIGEVARLCEVPAYVLRFWESEFPQLKPNKGGTGQRLYRKRDVETALRIKTLLYDQGYTIPGARAILKTELRSADPMPPAAPEPIAISSTPPSSHRDAQLHFLRDELSGLLAMLSRPASSQPSESAGTGKVKAMRPRLVLEPRPIAVAQPSRLRLAQPDLFGEFTGDAPESSSGVPDLFE